MSVQYDVCVVGAGLTGSAAARWASQRHGSKVCLVGPLEPSQEEWNDPNRTTFGAHYDEARIVSEVCAQRRDDTWPVVVRRSIDRFRGLERESGIKFYHEVGCVLKGHMDDISRVYKSLPSATASKVLTSKELSECIAYLVSDEEDFHSIFEPMNAGYVNPRNYILANKSIAKQNGCHIIDDVVCEVNQLQDPNFGGYVSLVTKHGHRTITAKRVLLCAGGFINFEKLLQVPGREIDITNRTETAVMIELREEDALRMARMPSVLVFVAEDDPRGSYILPPVRYPDGKYYLKVGHDADLNRPIRSYEEVTSWYRRKGEGHFDDFVSIYLRIYQSVTGFRPKSLHVIRCVTTYTPTGQFYCDMITPTVGVITGGNGAGAMAADEIGRMGARMILKGSWDSDLPASEFRVKWKREGDATKMKSLL